MFLLRFRRPPPHVTDERRSLGEHLGATVGHREAAARLIPIAALLILTRAAHSGGVRVRPLWLVDADPVGRIVRTGMGGVMASLGLSGLLAGRIGSIGGRH